MKPYKLLWFSEIQWDFLSTRKQRLLARFPDEWHILFIEPFTLGRKHHWLPVKRGRVWVVTVPFLKTIPFRFGALLKRPLVRTLAGLPGIAIMHLWTLLLGFSSSQRIIALSNPYWGKVASHLPCRFRCYDANDDHLAFPSTPSWLPDWLQRYLSTTSLVFSVSKELTARLPLSSSTKVVELGNGVEFNHFATPRQNKPSQLAALSGKILGYAGAMDWLDVDLLEKVAQTYHQYHLVLLGPAYEHGWMERQLGLQALPNVHYFGKIEYSELPAWVQAFSVALMPLVANPLKQVSHPNKLYEYLATGVPVVAMNYCSAVEAAADVVHVAQSYEEFVQLVPIALADNRREARQAFAKQHSWDALAATMVHELQHAWQESAP
uniref:Glycosyl transferase, group 1 family protein n=1 Tax=Chlorobium chlorochromatii (strain CaD3) TaxID=340177 RepID=Q3APG2_CHLCH